MMIKPRFKAYWAIEPGGFLVRDYACPGFYLWTFDDWTYLRNQYGNHHNSDLTDGRTVMVDHFQFAPNKPFGLGEDAGRAILRVNVAAVLGLSITRETIDEEYLKRCFSNADATAIMDVLCGGGKRLNGDTSVPALGDEMASDIYEAERLIRWIMLNDATRKPADVYHPASSNGAQDGG